MAQQGRLDLTADPVAAGFNQIHRLTTDDAMHPVGVDHRSVTGAVPTIGGERIGAGLRAVAVALEYGGRPDLQAPDAFAVMRHRRAVRCCQPRCHSRQRQTHQPGRRSPSARVLTVMRVSVHP